MSRYLIPYAMCGIVTFALHWQTLEGFRKEAEPHGYKVAFFAFTVAAWPLTIIGTVFLRDWDNGGRNG